MEWKCPHCQTLLSSDAVMGGICPECKKVVELSTMEKTEGPSPGATTEEIADHPVSNTGNLNFNEALLSVLSAG